MNYWTIRDNLLKPQPKLEPTFSLLKAQNLSWHACHYADKGEFEKALKCAAQAMEIFPRFWALMAAVGNVVPADVWEDGSPVEAVG